MQVIEIADELYYHETREDSDETNGLADVGAAKETQLDHITDSWNENLGNLLPSTNLPLMSMSRRTQYTSRVVMTQMYESCLDQKQSQCTKTMDTVGMGVEWSLTCLDTICEVLHVPRAVSARQ